MTIYGELLKKYEEVLGVERCKIILYNAGIESTNPLIEGFDDFDWSDLELNPTDLPTWVQSELNSNIPSFAIDEDILPRYVGNFTFFVKYNKILALDYVVIDIKRIKGV